MSGPRLRPRPGGALLALLALAAPLVGACGGAGASTELPPPAPRFDVQMREYAFGHAPQAQRGRVVFDIRNVGTVDHQATLVRLPDDFTGTIDAQLHSSTRIVLQTIVVVTRKSGQSDSFAANLSPGRYGFICYLTDADGVQHAYKGMSSEFSVA